MSIKADVTRWREVRGGEHAALGGGWRIKSVQPAKDSSSREVLMFGMRGFDERGGLGGEPKPQACDLLLLGLRSETIVLGKK